MFLRQFIVPKSVQLNRKLSSHVSTQHIPFIKIPGPKRIPFLGMLNDIMHLGKPAELHLRISKFHDLYGDMFRLQIGPQQAIFIRDPELMRKTFQLEGTYPRHPLPESWAYFNKKFDYQRGLFFMDGKDWLQSRQIFNKPLLKDFSWMEYPIQSVCEAKLRDVGKSCDSQFTFNGIEAFLYKWSVEVILSVILGSSFTQCQASPRFRELVDQFAQVVYDIFKYSSELMNIPPTIADRLNVQAWQQFERVVPETIHLATEIIEFGLQNASSNNGLLGLMSQKVDKSLMMRIFTDFIIAAGDTTAFATVWALYLLAKNPDVQQSVRVNIKESASLEGPAIKGVVRETLRLYPVAPFIGRFIENDALFDNHVIPKNTLVLLSLYSSGRDERFFSNPEQFNPQRWNRSDVKNTTDTTTASASLPFAIGARSCIGQKIAQMQMHYLLSMILMNFELSIPKQQQEITPILKLITVPNISVNLTFKTI